MHETCSNHVQRFADTSWEYNFCSSGSMWRRSCNALVVVLAKKGCEKKVADGH